MDKDKALEIFKKSVALEILRETHISRKFMKRRETMKRPLSGRQRALNSIILNPLRFWAIFT